MPWAGGIVCLSIGKFLLMDSILEAHLAQVALETFVICAGKNILLSSFLELFSGIL